MGKAYRAPTFHVTGITMRKPQSKPIIFALGVHTLDDHNIDTSVREAAIYELCNRLQPGIVQNVVIPYCMTDWAAASSRSRSAINSTRAGSAISWQRRSPARRACGWQSR